MERRGKKTLFFCIVGIFVFLLAGQIPQYLIYAKTQSLKYRWFFKKEFNGLSTLTKGDYVTISHFTQDIDDCSPCKLTKKIACTEGEKLTVIGSQFFCNERLVATAKALSLKGKPLTHFEWDGKIPPGKLFLTGSHKDSYDGRYFGFKEKKDVETIAVPIF